MMKTYKQQKQENEIKKEWLKRVVNDELDDCFGIIHNPSLMDDIFFIDVDARTVSISQECPELDMSSLGSLHEEHLFTPRPLCEISGYLREIKITARDK